MDYAAQQGHLEVVKWLHENRTEGCTTKAMNWAAENGHLEVVKWLHENRTEGCTTQAMDWASCNGHLNVVKWLHENRTEGCTIKAMNWAAHNGHLEVIKWLHENRTEGCTVNAMNWAVHNGHLEVIKWLHANRIEGCSRWWAMQNADYFNRHANRAAIVKWLPMPRQCLANALSSSSIGPVSIKKSGSSSKRGIPSSWSVNTRHTEELYTRLYNPPPPMRVGSNASCAILEYW